MRYRRAVERLRQLAQDCERTRRVPAQEPFLRAAHVLGDVLAGADPVDRLEVVFVLNLPPEEVSWGAQPPGTAWLVDFLRLDQGGVDYWWRSRHDPVANHRIHDPVRFWSLDGPDGAVLDALAERRFDLVREAPRPEEERADVEGELRTALEHLRAVRDSYWDRQWRRKHRGLARHPEHHLWEAVQGYLDLLDLSSDRPEAVHPERDGNA
ncbi:hypothetical protein FH608_007255 [Nonomuraea phyllanthi]|uniref:DUF7711 domain-containing protein n=1 Tax=Nonomuraea phyllanthi TaxID=2219224 RepID=A0A5C4WT85_9ACTN|nr:hypothetical protein [Nonomuraea phyllanthi]KAB8196524.1 hypothetical protein FH608_007255 [Nonomuraea phyllanthi]